MSDDASAALEDLLQVMDLARGPNEIEPPALHLTTARAIRRAFRTALTLEGQDQGIRFLAKELKGAHPETLYVTMASLLDRNVSDDFPNEDRDAARIGIAGVAALDRGLPDPGPCASANYIEMTGHTQEGPAWPIDTRSPRQILCGVAPAPGLSPTIKKLCTDVADGVLGAEDRELLRRMRDALEGRPQIVGAGGLTHDDAMEKLRDERHDEWATTECSEEPPPAEHAPVVLQGQGEPVLVLGKEKPRLTSVRYDVVKALLAAGKDGLTKDDLDRKSGHTEARKRLYDVAKLNEDWNSVIQLPEKSGGRYRIRRS